MAAAKDLLDFIDWSQVECLNEDPKHPAANALKQGYREQDDLVLASDADEQLLLSIHCACRCGVCWPAACERLHAC
jgi:hypothetical protein